MSFQPLPTFLEMDKLYLDIRLEAIPLLKNSVVDLMGSKTFSVGMMRENKGFGIIDIQVETKTSLQPIIDITFKDLYGNTVFEKLDNVDGNGSELDYSLLFDWPPPKFRFTFKGYLGKPVVWIMNLKKTHTRYNSSDGSYEIKASFVPNQFGFLADIPFLYLLAKKRLKRDVNGEANSNTNILPKQNKIESIFDIIKIGKTIETKTKQVTKEYDKLQKQLSILKINSIDGLINKDFEPRDVIDGKVAGRPTIARVKNVSGQNDLPAFSIITIKLPPSLEKDSGNSSKFQEVLKSLKGNPTQSNIEHRKIIALIGNPDSVAKNMTILGSDSNGTLTGKFADASATSFQNDVKAGLKKIDDNLNLIEVEKKRRLFQTSETQLGAVTISEVFSRLAADGGYILGSILDAGYNGYNLNEKVRILNKLPNGDKLIGKFFPLTIDSKGEQVPATEAGIETEGCEMSFVRRFLTAISEGIAENQSSQNQDALNNSENKIISRINNLEIISPNPYKDASGQQFLETLLVRSGIAAFITRSFDSNQPGDYNTSGLDDDSPDQIEKLADKELKNITDVILSSLTTEDYGYVKKFCRFINNLLTSDGEGLYMYGINSNTETEIVKVSKTPIQTIKTHAVIAKGTGESKEFLGTVDSMFKNFLGTGNTKSIFYPGSDATYTREISDSINYDDFTAKYLYNNNTLWMIPDIDAYKTLTSIDSFLNPLSDTPLNKIKYSFVIFDKSSDQGAIDGVQNSDTDSEFSDKKHKETEEPLGVVKISNGNSDEEQNKDEFQRVKTINSHIPFCTVFDYSKLQNLKSIPLLDGYPDVSMLNDGKGVYYYKIIDQDNIGNGVTYLAYSQITDDNSPRLTWGLFLPKQNATDVRGKNQRIFLRKICVDIENRMSKLEDEKNNILSQVLGRAQSNENSLYIQMHHIFHQWGVLGYSMDNVSINTNKSSDGSNKPKNQPIEPKTIADTLEKEYGTIIEEIEGGKITKSRSVEDLPGEKSSLGTLTSSTGFKYDFPMEKINPPAILTNVAHSIINIDSLYKPNANTTLLNIIQQLCTKNNFMFIPIPGNIDYSNISEIFKPSNNVEPKIGNVFHVLFTPTPENRTKENDGTSLSLTSVAQNSKMDAFEINFGSPDNPVVKNIDVSTDESRPTAESILNLQRLVDKDNSNKVVTTDCSILSVMEGRSYKMKVDVIGNAQISPMQYFHVAKHPIFSGLYQIMNVTHSIKPNDMSTTFEGIKMRFDGTSMKGIGPITLESLKALCSEESSIIQPNVGTTSPTSFEGAVLQGLLNPFQDVPNNSDLDLIPGTYLNNNKKPITLIQVDGRPVEMVTAKAYLTMQSAASKEGISFRIISGFRPQFGGNLNVVSSKGVLVKAESQHTLRVSNLKTPNYPDQNNITNPQGINVNVDSDTLKPQKFIQISPNKTQGYFLANVAAPGQSNHGNGIALDLNTGTRNIDKNHTSPLKDATYIWLIQNSWKFGFVRTVKGEEWHFDYRPDLAKLGPYGGFADMSNPATFPGSIQSRNSSLFYTDLGLSNLITPST